MKKLLRYCDHIIFGCLLLFTFALPLSITVSEPLLALGVIWWAIKVARDKRIRWQRSALDIPILAFVVVAFLSSFWGVDIKNSLIGFRTYSLILAIYIVLNNVAESGRRRMLVWSLIAGTSVLSIFTVTDRLSRIASGADPVLAGSMSEAGQLLIVIGITVALLLYEKEKRTKILLLTALLIMVLAEILNFKRGSWMALILVLLIQGWFKSRKVIPIIVIASIAIFFFYQPARGRLLSLKTEFSTARGGRLAMWGIVPEVLKDHPMGVGIDNVGSVMYRYDPGIEEGRDHVHNTSLQILVEMGPLGLLAFAWWMIVFLKVSFRTFRRIENNYQKALALGIFSSFIGFLVNGMVEFNFGDSEVVMIIYFLMGLTLVEDCRMRGAECRVDRQPLSIPRLKSILIVKLGSLGDIVHALPLANTLRSNLPGVRIDWVIDGRFSALLEHHPAIDEVIVLDRSRFPIKTLFSFIGVIRKLRSKRYDMLIDLQGSLKGSPVVLLGGCSRKMGFRRGSSRIETASTFFTNWKVLEEGSHIIERNLSFAGALGVEPGEISFRIPVSVSAKKHVDDFLRLQNIHGKRIVVMHPGVTWVTKRWPLERYACLAEEIVRRFPDVAVVVTIGPGEESLEDGLKERSKRDIIVPSAGMSLCQLIALIDRCELLIGSDTGPLHLAAALGKRVVGLYGPTDRVRNGPYGEGHSVVSANRACSGCWRRECRDLGCMNEIQVSDVMEKVAVCLEGRNVLSAA